MELTADPYVSHQAFLSYSSADRADAGKIRQFLEEKGVRVWSDEDLEPGENIPVAIQQAINEADVVVILLSELEETSEWMWFEAAAAVAAQSIGDHKRIIPVVLHRGAQVPPMLSDFDHVDLSESSNWESQMVHLASAVQKGQVRFSAEDERRLMRERLNAERLALEVEEIESQAHHETLERLLYLSLSAVAGLSAVTLLFLSLTGLVDGRASALPGVILGLIVGALAARLSSARSCDRSTP